MFGPSLTPPPLPPVRSEADPPGAWVSTGLHRPFPEQMWLNTAYQDTLLPGAKWHDVAEKLNVSLARKVARQFEFPQRKQMLLQLVGTEFVKKFFPKEKIDTSLISPPEMTWEQRQRLQMEAQTWLQNQLYKSCLETRCFRIETAVKSNDPMAEEMKTYLEHAYSICATRLSQELARREVKHLQNAHKTAQMRSKLMKDLQTNKGQRTNRLPLTNRSTAPVTEEELDNLPGAPADIRLLKEEFSYSAKPPLYSSFHSEHIGDSMADILRADPSRFSEVASKMTGRRLPQSLRRYMWRDVLFKEERERLKDANVERLVRERFGKAVARGVSDLRIQRATQSPINSLLENAVIEMFEKTACLSEFNKTPYLTESVRILNVLYVYDRSYEPFLIQWLFPLQMAFKEDDKGKDVGEHIYEMAMLLDLLHKGVFPSWANVFSMAERVMLLLEQADPDYHAHLRDICNKNVDINPKEFMVQLIHQERERALALLNATPGPHQTEMSRELLSDPLVFLRKWIGEAFVSVLRVNATLFFWDQLVLEHFHQGVFEDMALALLLLLRTNFMAAVDHQTMKDCFLYQPSPLYTLDVIRAWVWIHKGGDPSQVPLMNRLLVEEVPLPPPRISIPGTPTPVETKILDPVGLDGIKVKLILPKNSDNRNSWIAAFQHQRLLITANLYYGSLKVKTKTSTSDPVLKFADEEKNKPNIYLILVHYPEEKFVFENVDISNYDVEEELGAFPYLVVRVEYVNAEAVSGKACLGWVSIDAYRRGEGVAPPDPPAELADASGPNKTPADGAKPAQKSQRASQPPASQGNESPYFKAPSRGKGREAQWIANVSRKEYPLVMGDVPADPSTGAAPDDDKAKDAATDLLADGSLLGAHVFDPRTGTSPGIPSPTPLPHQATPPPKQEPQPVKEPTPEPEAEPEPEPEGPVESPPPTPMDDAWVPFKEKAARMIDPQPSSNTEPFCLYIDQLRFLPDTTTIVKVTGRFLNTGADSEIDDILVFPDYESPPRSPQFRETSVVVVNKKKSLLSAETVLLLRVYTVFKKNLEIMIIGNCLVKIFDKDGKLRVGGFQKRLRNQLPESGLVGLEGLRADSLDGAPSVPAVSILFRLLPFTARPVKAPAYRTCSYRSSDSTPTNLEWELFKLYSSDRTYPTNLRDVVRDLKLRSGERDKKNQGLTNAFMRTFVPQRLDVTKHLPPNTAPKHMPTSVMYRYRMEKGIRLKVERAYGLTEGLLCFAVVKFFLGRTAAQQEPRPSKGWGIDEEIIVTQLDFQSLLKAPVWTDELYVTRPYQDPNSLMIVQVFGLDLEYKDGEFFTPNGTAPAKLTAQNLLGWSAITLFELDFVNAARHFLPVFQTRLHPALMKRFQTQSIGTVLQREDQFRDIDADSIIVALADGHDPSKEMPRDLKDDKSLIDVLPEKKAAAEAAQKDSSGTRVKDVIVKSLPDTQQGFGDTTQAFREEGKRFREAFKALAERLVASVPKKRPFQPLFT